LTSVIIPLYNREKLIRETIESIIKQSFVHFEVLIIDDGSTDNSPQLIKSFFQKDSRIRLFERPSNLPKGAPTCRNLGIEYAKGEYIIFLDSDDLLASFCLEQRVNFMEEHPGLDFAVFPQLLFYNIPGDSKRLVNIITDEDDITRFLKLARGTDPPWINNSPIWRKKSLLKYNHRWNNNILGYQDIDFHLRALLSDMKYKKVDAQPDCFWRQHSGERVGIFFFSEEKSKSHEHLFISFASELFHRGILTPKREEILHKCFFTLIEIYIVQQKFQQAKEFAEKIQQLQFLNTDFLQQLDIYLWLQTTLKKNALMRRSVNFVLRKIYFGNFYQPNANYHFTKHNFVGVIKI